MSDSYFNGKLLLKKCWFSCLSQAVLSENGKKKKQQQKLNYF